MPNDLLKDIAKQKEEQENKQEERKSASKSTYDVMDAARVFDHYSLAIEPALANNWRERYRLFMSSSTFKIIRFPTELIQQGKTKTIHTEKYIPDDVTVKEGHPKNMHDLLDEIVSKACEELLNENGELKKKAIELLDLQSLTEHFETTPKKMEEIKLYVIHAYCKKTLNQLLDTQFLKEKFKYKNQEFTFFIKDYFLTQEKEKIAEGEILSFHFSERFKKIINNHHRILFNKKSIPEQCATELVNLNPEDIKNILFHDFNKMKKTYAQFVLMDKANPSTQFTPIFARAFQHKMHFWIDVCEACRHQIVRGNQPEKYFSLMQTVLADIKAKQEGKNKDFYKITEDFSIKLDACRQIILPPLEENKSEPLSPQAKKNHIDKTYHLLMIDKNKFIIDNIQDQMKGKQLSDADKKNLEWIASQKNDLDTLKKKPVEMLTLFRTMTSDHSAIAPILDAYQQSFDYEAFAFFKRADTDVATLQSTFSKLPRDVKRYEIPNAIDPTNLEKPLLSLNDAVKTLANRITQLKSRPTSDKEYINAVKFWNSIMSTITDGMIMAIHKNLLTGTTAAPYMEANQEIRELRQQFNLTYMKTQQGKSIFRGPVRLNDSLKRLDEGSLTLAKWQEIFNAFCESSIKYATKFNTFNRAFNEVKNSDTVNNNQYGELLAQKFNLKTETERSENKKQMEEVMEKQHRYLIKILSDQESFNELGIAALSSAEPPYPDRSAIITKNVSSLHPKQIKILEELGELVDGTLFEDGFALPNSNALAKEAAGFNHVDTPDAEKANTDNYPNLNRAAFLLSQLPPRVAANLQDYCHFRDQDRKTLKNAKLYPPFKKVYMEANEKWASEQKSTQHLEVKHESAVTFHLPEGSTAIEKHIKAILRTGTTKEEQFLLLSAAQKELSETSQLYKSLNNSIREIGDHDEMKIPPNGYFDKAATLLKYAYDTKASMLNKFTPKTAEVNAAYTIALLMIQIDLLICSTPAQDRSAALRNKLSILCDKLDEVKTLDKKFTALLAPALLKVQADLRTFTLKETPTKKRLL